jgi:uncharacterized protein (DUF4415 family)
MSKPSKTNWDRVDALRDEDSDYSDNLRLTPDFFGHAVRWPAKKELISLRLGPDLLAFLRSRGKGYQTLINNLLRRYMEAEQQRNPASKRKQSRRRA